MATTVGGYNHLWLAAQWLQPSVASRLVFTVDGTEPLKLSGHFLAAVALPTVANVLSGTVFGNAIKSVHCSSLIK